MTTSALDYRAKASTSAAVLSVIPSGANVGDEGGSSNGFRKVRDDGAIGWCWSDHLSCQSSRLDGSHRRGPVRLPRTEP